MGPVKSQRFFKGRRKAGELESKKELELGSRGEREGSDGWKTLCCWLSKWRDHRSHKEPQVKECEQPLQAEKPKETNPLLEPS